MIPIGIFVLKLVSFPVNFLVASTLLDPYIAITFLEFFQNFPEFSRIL
jgi:hypothetical protein